MEKTASAKWRGGLKAGSGTVSMQSGLFADAPYSFARRFGDEPGTNPEELVAAAHAACFSMAFGAQLEAAGFPPELVETTATVTLEKVGDGFSVTRSHLATEARAPGLEEARFQEIAASAKAGCPISRLLSAEITLSAKLER